MSGGSSRPQRWLSDGLADLVEQGPVGPAAGESDADDSRADQDFGGDFHQAASPGAGVTFAEWIVFASSVVVAFAIASFPLRDRQFGGRLGPRWLGDVSPQTDQQIVSPRVQVESKQVGQVAMVTQPIRTQTTFEFLVAILALAAFGVFVVGRCGQDVGAASMGDHGPAVGAGPRI